ncbi:uncharacterized protein LOC141718284 [Apium graveolens]|uniref:uncharacterized protein LOC141718284 n=1 Tax=Apium graveolens TaxID=4045 RepID=UPI003D79FEB0
MHPDRSPGPDGFSPGFYQKFWSIIFVDMLNLVQDFFSQGRLENEIGNTNIALISKVKNPATMRDLRPTVQCDLQGRNFGSITLTRGLRHGDPISSYLFLICMEGLSILLQEYERRNYLTGIQVARGAPRLTHMFFADDTYIYCKAQVDQTNHVIELFKIFDCASCQKINADKSYVFFSRNTDPEVKNVICIMLQFKEVDSNTKYLGLPNTLGSNKNVMLSYLRERLKDRYGEDYEFVLVERVYNGYRYSLLRWDSMCERKSAGGFGFRKLQSFNIALLGKQGWRLLTNTDSLVSEIYKARYYPEGSFLTAKTGGNPSYIWRSIMEAQVLSKQGAVRQVGTGSTINILNDPWLPDKDPYVHTVHKALNHNTSNVLMNSESNSWDTDLARDIFVERDVNLILSIPLNNAVADTWYWRFEKLGHYSVKSAYIAIRDYTCTNRVEDNFNWKQVWDLQIPLKVKNFIWRAITNVLPTKDQLLIKRVPVLVMCPWFANTVQSLEKKAIEEMIMVCWEIWKNRNAIIWKQYGSEFSEDGLEQWVRPLDGMIKINVDTTIFEDTSKYCYSMIARDGAGELVTATAKCRSGTIVPEMAKAIGIKEAVKLDKTRGYSTSYS